MTTAGTQPTAVVLGLGQNGMATCRALGRVGIPVIGIDTDLDQPSARTRYATKFHCPDFLSGGPGLVESLEQIGRGLPEKGVLFPSGDLNLAVISEHRERLEPYFHISLPPKPVVEMFLNKKMFYQFAMDKGFPLPQTLFPTSPEHMRELAGAASVSLPHQAVPAQRRLAEDLRHAPVRRGLGGQSRRALRAAVPCPRGPDRPGVHAGPRQRAVVGRDVPRRGGPAARRLDRTQAPAVSPPIRHRDARGEPMGSRSSRASRSPSSRRWAIAAMASSSTSATAATAA